MESRKGQQLGHYQLQKRLGQGGFASVYSAIDLHLQRSVAIKVLRERIDNQVSREAFLREAQAIAQLKHPHIVQVLAFDVENDTPFLVMDLAPGGSLRFSSGILLPIAKIIPYVQQVASALDYAHGKKLIHRDVKPENMLFGPGGDVLLGDFGLAQLAQTSNRQVTGDGAGTPNYMAPEQACGKPCFASDQYALGVVVYEWLTGSVPFQGDSPWAVLHQHANSAPPSLRLRNPQVPLELEQTVLKALAKDPTQRFASVSEFAEVIAQTSQVSYYARDLSFPEKDDEEFFSTLIRPHPQPPVVSGSFGLEDDLLSPERQTHPVFSYNHRETRPFSLRSASHAPSSQFQQDSGIDFSTIPMAMQDSFGQPAPRERQDYLRWLLLGCAIVGTFLLSGGLLLQQPQIWVGGIVLVVASALLGVIQATQRDQWFWFIGFLMFSPLTGLVYGILHPHQKAYPPVGMRQLIFVTGLLGLLFFVSGFVGGSVSPGTLSTLGILLLVIGLDLSFNHWVLAWIRAERLGEDTEDFIWSFLFLGPLWKGLATVWNDDRDP